MYQNIEQFFLSLTQCLPKSFNHIINWARVTCRRYERGRCRLHGQSCASHVGNIACMKNDIDGYIMRI